MMGTVLAGLLLQLGFTEVAVASGIDATMANMPAFPYDRMNGGGAIGDLDGDGLPDVFLPSTGLTPDRIYRNDGDGTFTLQPMVSDREAEHRGCGVAIGDYDGDGLQDVFVTSFGDASAPIAPGQNRLYRNLGDGTFDERAAEAGVAFSSTIVPDGYGASFADYDLDGDLDLFVCAWTQFSEGNRLFRNDGDGTFTDVTVASGLLIQQWSGFAPCFTDMDGDRRPDLLVASDFGTTRVFQNLATGFVDRTVKLTPDVVYNGMGHCVADFNGDGRTDWFVTSVFHEGPTPDPNGNRLYLNRGDARRLVAAPATAGVRDGGWGWGAVACDFDHDGDVDIAEVNGWSDPEWVDERSYLYLNRGNARFDERGVAAGFDDDGQGRTLLSFDYDVDGDMDLLVVNNNGPVRLYRNDLGGPGTHWLRVELDTSARPDLAPAGLGTRLQVRIGGRRQVAVLDGGSSYLGNSQATAHFGLGARTRVDELRIEWADGTTTVLTDVAADQVLQVAAQP